MKLNFCGDVALNGHWMNDPDIFDDTIKKYLSAADISLVNLETVVKGSSKPNPLKNPTLYTAEEAVLNLKNYNFHYYNLGNNHVNDYLDEGFEKTVENIKRIDGIPFGASLEGFFKPDGPVVINKDGVELLIFSYVDKNTHPGLKGDEKLKVRFFNEQNIREDLPKVTKKKNTYIIISVHWGLDNYRYPAPYQRNLAHLCIDSGADLVWGHHAHVIQPFEVYKNKHIFYCQGNACFDKVYDFVQLNKYQLESFFVELDLSYANDSITEKINTRKFVRKNSTASASFAKNNAPIKQIRGALVNLSAYSAFYKLYKMRFYSKKGFKYFFGYNRNPFKQFMKLFMKPNTNKS